MCHQTPKSSPIAVFEAIKSMNDGAIKKFELIKAFGLAVRQSGSRDPKAMSCSVLEKHISTIIRELR